MKDGRVQESRQCLDRTGRISSHAPATLAIKDKWDLGLRHQTAGGAKL